MSAYGVGSREARDIEVPSLNHCKTASLSPVLAKEIESKGLHRVAGNVYECRSQKDFWTVRGNKLVRLTVEEVDNGETLAAAPKDSPADFLQGILKDLTF